MEVVSCRPVDLILESTGVYTSLSEVGIILYKPVSNAMAMVSFVNLRNQNKKNFTNIMIFWK